MLIENTNVIEGAAGMGAPLRYAGAPVAGTDAVQTLTIDAEGGTFQLGFKGQKTEEIEWSATNGTLVSNIDTALEALPSVGAGNITTAAATLTSGVGTLTLTGAGDLAKRSLPLVTVEDNNLDGTGTLEIANTTPGVAPSFAGRAPKGAKLIDTTNGVDYINTGTQSIPVWTKTGTQS